MAETKTTKTTDRVKITVPRGGANDEPNVFIGINGVNYIIPKGKTSEVPAAVAAEYERMQAAIAAMYDKRDEMLDASK